MHRSTRQSINESIGQSIDQSRNQSTRQSINDPINHSINRSVLAGSNRVTTKKPKVFPCQSWTNGVTGVLILIIVLVQRPFLLQHWCHTPQKITITIVITSLSILFNWRVLVYSVAQRAPAILCLSSTNMSHVPNNGNHRVD